MGVLEVTALALSALTGGIVGAASAAYIAGLRVGESLNGFRAAFHAYMEGRTDEPSKLLTAAFDDLEAAWKTFGSALARLGNAAKHRKK